MTEFSPGLLSQSSTSPGFVKIEDASGTVINPATEETAQSIAGFNIPPYDQIVATYPNSTTEVYTYKMLGVTLNAITVVYTDSTKASISTVTKT